MIWVDVGWPDWFSILWHNGKQVEFSCGTDDLKQARKFHKAKLEELVLDKHGKAEFLVPAHQRLLFGSLLDDLIADYRVRSLMKSLGTVLSQVKPLRASFGRTLAFGKSGVGTRTACADMEAAPAEPLNPV